MKVPMFRHLFRHLLLGFAVAGLALVAPALHAAPPHIKVTWLGGPTVVIEFNGLKVLTDPMLGEGATAFTMGDPNEMFDLHKGPRIKIFQRLTPAPRLALKEINLLVLSHAREDHFDQIAQAKLDRATPVIVPAADADKLRGLGFKNTDGLPWGATRTFPAGAGHVTITAVPARHSENPAIDKILGVGNGYWFKFSQGDWQRTIYWSGDTFPTLDVVSAVKRLGRPDLMIPHVGGVGTTGALGQVSMSARQVVAFASAVSPKKVLPIHHSTYPLYLEPISVLVGESFGKPYGLDLISEGTSVQYD